MGGITEGTWVEGEDWRIRAKSRTVETMTELAEEKDLLKRTKEERQGGTMEYNEMNKDKK